MGGKGGRAGLQVWDEEEEEEEDSGKSCLRVFFQVLQKDEGFDLFFFQCACVSPNFNQ